MPVSCHFQGCRPVSGAISSTMPLPFCLLSPGRGHIWCFLQMGAEIEVTLGSACTMQPLAIWLTCVCRPTLCMVASNYVPRRLGLCWSRVPGLLPVSAASPSMDHEHGTVCQPILEHQIRLLLQASSQGPPVSAVVYAAACRWAQRRSSGAVVTV